MPTDRRPITWFTVGLLALATLGPAAPARAEAKPSAQQALLTSSQADHRLATADAERQANLVTGEDQRLTAALLKYRSDLQHPTNRTLPYNFRTSGLFTLVLTRRRAPYTFDDLRALAPQALIPQANGGFLLREHILVAAGATLAISPLKPLVIKMSSGPDGFVSLVTEGGQLRLNGTAAAPITFESWDESRGRPDRDVTDGRAYIRASGQLIVRHTTFSRLGFWSGRTGGLSVVGSGSSIDRDLALAATDGTLDSSSGSSGTPGSTGNRHSEVLPAGQLPVAEQDPSQSFAAQISDCTLTGNAFGLFITGTSGPRITNTVIRRSLVDGLVLHRNVNAAIISNVQVDQSGMDGVVVSREVEGTVLTGLNVQQSGRDGIVLAGQPLAEGPSASGSSTRAYGNNTLTASQSSGNLGIGIHVIGGTAVRLLGNTVSGGRSGIVVSNGASDIDIASNRVAEAATNGIQVRESRQVTLTGNVVRNSPTGIHIRNSVSSLLQNSTSGVTLHGITFVGQVAGSVAESNLLAGSGTSAIDLVRVTGHRGPTLQQNDLSGWSRTVTSDSLLSLLLHPLTVIWMFIALALIAMSRPRRTVSRASRAPYRIDPLSESPSRSTPISTPPPARSTGSRSTEPAIFVIPDRRRPSPADPPLVATLPNRNPPEPPREPLPEPTMEPAMAGRSMVDLAIQDSRLSPAAPRRRRVVGR